jgi:hypothetical protein
MNALLFVCSVLLFLPSFARAATYRVQPDGAGDFPTIQAAIDACRDGDVVELADGQFRGVGNRDIEFKGRAITVRSVSDDPRTCIIDCEGLGRAFYINWGEGPQSILRGVSMVHGYQGYGGTVYLASSSPTFVKCVFANGEGDGDGAIHT